MHYAETPLESDAEYSQLAQSSLYIAHDLQNSNEKIPQPSYDIPTERRMVIRNAQGWQAL